MPETRKMQGEEIKARRKEAGMSQSELADAIGMARETIGQMERGTAPIELRTALAIRHVTEGNIVATRSAVDTHRHVATVLADIVKKGRIDPDDVQELKQAAVDWLPGGGGEIGDWLVTAAISIATKIRSNEPGSAIFQANVAEFLKLQKAWMAID
jgi:DNA-binding XRE family transcriptional regulator